MCNENGAVVLRSEKRICGHGMKSSTNLLESEYRADRDRQMKELALEDDLFNEIPVR